MTRSHDPDHLAAGPPRGPDVDVHFEFSARAIWEVPFWNLAARAGHRHLHRRAFPSTATAAPGLEDLGGTLVFSEDADRGRRLWTYTFQRDACCLLCVRHSQLELFVLSGAPASSARLADELEARLRAPEADDDGLALSYWTLAPSGPRRSNRQLEVPAWEQIAGNYPEALAQQLAGLMSERRPGPGRLLLWHGAPGTGKTTALRALAHAWRDWATVHYIVDPEMFFGTGASYMTEVLMHATDAAGSRDRTMLLVLEDAGELMLPDARRDTGQGLSRLLNLSDGMLGQGLDALVMLTTNEPLGGLHPAVSRPGRCLSELEFGPLPHEQANRWLSDHGSGLRVSTATPLADLYALARGEAPCERRQIGFAAR